MAGTIHPDEVVVSAAGTIDLDTVDLLRTALLQAVGRHARVCCDLTEVTFCAAAGVNALVEAHNRAVRHGARLSVRGAHGIVRQVLQITGLNQLLT